MSWKLEVWCVQIFGCHIICSCRRRLLFSSLWSSTERIPFQRKDNETIESVAATSVQKTHMYLVPTYDTWPLFELRVPRRRWEATTCRPSHDEWIKIASYSVISSFLCAFELLFLFNYLFLHFYSSWCIEIERYRAMNILSPPHKTIIKSLALTLTSGSQWSFVVFKYWLLSPSLPVSISLSLSTLHV